MNFGAKVPGSLTEIRQVNMDFLYTGSFTETSPEAYERLILDLTFVSQFDSNKNRYKQLIENVRKVESFNLLDCFMARFC